MLLLIRGGFRSQLSETTQYLIGNSKNMSTAQLRIIDIGANLTDPVFCGYYHGKQVHPDDFNAVLERSFSAGVDKVIVTGGSLSDSKKALDLIQCNDKLYCTVGCHPTRCKEFDATSPDGYLHQLLQLASGNRGKVVAIGEFGLDYDRLHFCEKHIQKKYFEKQFELIEKTQLPMFLHCRNAFGDFLDILQRNRGRFDCGVVHSFTGTVDEAMSILKFNLYIGVNGCSLKTDENLEVIKTIPLDRILIETDAPWCEIRPTHASFKFVNTQFPSKKKERWEQGLSVKGRNEPRNIIQILEVLSTLHQRDKYELAEIIYKNTCSVFKFV